MQKRLTSCAWCAKPIWRMPINHNTGKPIVTSFCDTTCKGNWQRENLKPSGVTREWLVQKYEVDGLDCAEIGRLVHRDTKRVWEWLRDYGIKIRGRGSSVRKQWERGDRTPRPGTPHSSEAKDKMRQARIRDGRRPYMMPDGTHYMRGRRGDAHHGWRGGLTPERAVLANTDEWKETVKAVWHRADAKCERCGADHRAVDNRKEDGFHIHHIQPFDVVHLRCEVSNLVLLCRPCHHFVHSKRNKNREFLPND